MKAGWKTVKIGEILDKTENIDPTSFPEREYDYIDVSSVSNKSFSVEETQRIKGKDAPSRARKLVRTNDVLFATIRPTLQRIAIIPSRLDGQICSTGYFVLRPKEVISSRFIYYALMTDSFRSQMERLQKGASYPAVTDGDVRDQEVPLPPLAEQKRIVALLDEAFAGINEAKAKAEAKTQQLESFIPSAWSNLLPSTLSKWPDAKSSPDPELPNGWSIKTIEDISEKNGPVRYGILQPGPHVENGVPYVRPTEIVNDLIPEGSLRRTSTKIASMYSRSVLKPNDVILTIVGTIGKVALVPKWLEGGNVTQSSARIRPEASQCSPDYLAAMLRSPILRRQFEHYRMGAAVTRLNIADVKTLRIPLPPLSIQSSIVKNLDSLKAHHAILTDNNDFIYRELASLKSSILEKAFAGELTA